MVFLRSCAATTKGMILFWGRIVTSGASSRSSYPPYMGLAYLSVPYADCPAKLAEMSNLSLAPDRHMRVLFVEDAHIQGVSTSTIG